jgi:hypothetical protein
LKAGSSPRWPLKPATTRAASECGGVQELEGTARAFRAWDHRFGGGLRRKAVVGQLNEVAGHLEEHQAPDVERRLFQVMAYLGGTAATIAWDCGTATAGAELLPARPTSGSRRR